MRACRRVICVGSCTCAAVAQVQARVRVLMRFWRLQPQALVKQGQVLSTGMAVSEQVAAVEGGACCGSRAQHSQQHHPMSQARPSSRRRCRCSRTWQVCRSFARVCGAAQAFILACVYVNEYDSRAQPLQISCSARVTRCLCAPVPANGFGLVWTNA